MTRDGPCVLRMALFSFSTCGWLNLRSRPHRHEGQPRWGSGHLCVNTRVQSHCFTLLASPLRCLSCAVEREVELCRLLTGLSFLGTHRPAGEPVLRAEQEDVAMVDEAVAPLLAGSAPQQRCVVTWLEWKLVPSAVLCTW